MRILFVSGVDVGGAPLSTLALAGRLAARGHAVEVLLGGTPWPRHLHDVALRGAVKLRERAGWRWPRVLFRPLGRIGLRSRPGPAGVRVWSHPSPENAVARVAGSLRPEVVIANSLPRERMRWLVADTQRRGGRVVLYLREDHALSHLTVSGLPFDAVIANSGYLAEQARAAGYDCAYLPSIVELDAAATTSSRRTMLLVNPVAENRPEILRELARSRPDIPCVLQESWTLAEAERAKLQRWAEELPNLTLRARTDRVAELYADARILVAPYPGGRPRTVLEAQSNAIPVVGLAQPALAEAIGPGGLLVPASAATAQWVETLRQLWDDQPRYARLRALAEQHARRPEIDPDQLTTRFERILAEVVR